MASARPWIKAAAALVVLLRGIIPAAAGAWTEDVDQGQFIATVTGAAADRGFDAAGTAQPSPSHRLLLQTYTAYGWREGITVFATTESVYARVGAVTAFDNGVDAGARLRLWYGDSDIVSAEVSARTAGAYNYSVSNGGDHASSALGARLLYGHGFALDGMNGFVDVQLGQRWITAPRPSEAGLDLTAGLWLDPDWMAMIQSFNLMSEGRPRAPYVSFRQHKIELSAVWRLSQAWSVQAGGFFSPRGRNALNEQGLLLAAWTRF
jgi:hypothetical protein